MRLSEYFRFQYLNSKEREQFVLDGFNKMIKYVKQLPFYSILYKDVNKITTVEEIQTIPILTKRMLIETQEKWYFDDYIQLVQTSGTSGFSLSIPFCQHMAQRNVQSSIFFADMLGALGKKLYLFGTGPGLRMFSIIPPKWFKPSAVQLPTDVSKLPEVFKEHRPRYLIAAPITFESLFEINPDVNLDYVRSVCLTGMATPPELRAELEKREIEVLEGYHSFEFMSIAIECPMHKGMHVLYPYYIEKENDDKLIISDLDIRAAPFLRYDFRDYLIEFNTDECDCGRASPRIKIGGRALDRIVIDGKVYYPSSVVFAIKEVIQKEQIKIEEWQLIQYANREFTLKVVGTDDVTPILNKLCELFGEVEIEVERVDQIPKGTLGKKYWILNRTARE